MMRVAVLGLGSMGMGMARCLLNQGLDVVGFDIAPAQLQKAASYGLTTATSSAEAVRDRQVVLVAVRDAAQLDDLLFGADGIAPHLAKGAVVVLTSTIGAEGLSALVERLSEHQVQLVDAPLSGGPARALAGDLLVVVGAEPSARELAAPVLEAIASTLTVVGDHPGDGQAFKTVNQLLCGVHIAAAAEALNLARAMDLDPAVVLPNLMSGAAASFMLGDRGQRMLQDDPEVLSRLDIFVKDMGIVTSAARANHVATPIAAAAQQLYLLGEAAGLGAEDDSTVLRVLDPEASGRSSATASDAPEEPAESGPDTETPKA